MYSRTALVTNNPFEPFQADSKLPFFYRECNCDTNLTSNTPANQYQRQKIIQNTVRVPSSLYSMNLAALNVYQKPSSVYSVIDVGGSNYIVSPGVNWNQMSDRKTPHLQPFATSSGSTYRGSSTKRSITSLRPGAMSPGGAGVDIKHNSYDRYLNRLKGKAPLRRGVIPPNFGAPIPFNRAFPVYGGKTTKTSIVSRCNCPIVSKTDDSKIYNNPLYYPETNITCTDVFKVGDYVYTTEGSSPYYVKALITGYDTNTQIYTVNFVDSGVDESKQCNQLRIYFPCDCIPSDDPNSLYVKSISDISTGGSCLYSAEYLALKGIL